MKKYRLLYELSYNRGVFMKNVVIADVNTACRCDCVENVLDGTNSITFNFKASAPVAPKAEIDVVYNDETTENFTDDLDSTLEYTIDVSKYTKGGILKIRYLDEDYTGTWFTINCINYNGSVPYGRTLLLIKISDFEYSLSAQLLSKYSDMTINDLSGVLDEETIEEMTQELKKINVTETNNQVSNVSLIYDQETKTEEGTETKEIEKSYHCEYDSNGHLIKFGAIEITWGGG